MEDFTIITPSLLFSAISLIMLAYTNRFLAYASVIRNLKAEYDVSHSGITAAQIQNIRTRLYLTRSMQILGISSLLVCVVSMLFIYFQFRLIAIYSFATALVLLAISLVFSIWEILISVRALEVHLDGMKGSLPKDLK